MRPLIHFTPTRGWNNDPLGVTFRDGRYHLFYQSVPDSLEWRSDCRWGHATSADLLRWADHGVSLAPDDEDDGVWSGSIAGDGEAATLFYTSVREPDLAIGRVRLAVPADASWQAWTKLPGALEAPASLELTTFRDPFVFRDGDRWRMFVGAGLADGQAAAIGFLSDDLRAPGAAPVLPRHAPRTRPNRRGPARCGSARSCSASMAGKRC